MPNSSAATFGSVLDDLLRRDPGRPLVTFYDHATGERVELSVTTYANWVAKVAGLLVEECDLERGQRLLVDLPPHWLGPVFLGAAWRVGLSVVHDEPADAVVCGPDSVERWAGSAATRPVLACSLLPLGVRFRDPLPAGVLDVGVEVWSQPDAFSPYDPPTAQDDALPGTSQGDLMATAAAGSLLSDGGRLLTVSNPTSPSGVATFTEPLVRRGSMVLVAQPDQDRLAATARDERVTATCPAGLLAGPAD
ncbi:TIGR03089 family protein [Nocardioides campestrisoli]|uniref:TIGR03089 family protein n=1 Tax=Nocardioides campestrisoli TaxID=2736757 RepID=UPI002811B8DA|nr:TIGR03089 family protein [Nocardioides campestrisoli]